MTDPPAGLTYAAGAARAGRARPLRDPARPRPDAGAAARARRSRSGRSAARSSPGPTARAASSPSPRSALRAAGYRVGTTPKPHLVTYRERIQVDGRPIAADDFARLVGRVLAVADRVAPRYGEPTEFELLTAVVFARFAEVRPDVALVEVGLGGRLDATHAWDGGVAVVTNVDLDHMDRLGDTVTKIAREKAAIIERGDLAVTGARGDGLAVIRRRARRLGVPLTEVAAGAAPRLGPRRDRGRPAAPRADPGRPARPAPGGQRRHRRRDARRARGRRDRDRPGRRPAGAATRPRSGRAASSCSRVGRPRRPPRRRPQPGRRGGPGAWPSTTCGRTSARRRRSRSSRRRWPTRTSTASSRALAASRGAGRCDGHLHEPRRARGRCRPPSSPRAGGRALGVPAPAVVASRSDRRARARPWPTAGTGRRGRFALSCRGGARPPRRRPGPARPRPPEDP